MHTRWDRYHYQNFANSGTKTKLSCEAAFHLPVPLQNQVSVPCHFVEVIFFHYGHASFHLNSQFHVDHQEGLKLCTWYSYGCHCGPCFLALWQLSIFFSSTFKCTSQNIIGFVIKILWTGSESSKNHKTKIWKFSPNTLGIDARFYNVSKTHKKFFLIFISIMRQVTNEKLMTI